MQEKTIEELRQELKDQIEENKELNDSITWWKNRYEAQIKINKEHKKLNGDLRKENDALITVIDLVKEYCDREIGNIIANFDYIQTTDLENIKKILERVDEE